MGIGSIGTRQQMAVVGSVKLPLIATEDIPAFRVATDTGKNADSSNIFHKNIIIGLTVADIVSGFSGTVVKTGQIHNPLWSWTKGDIIFLNGTTLSIIPPSTGIRVIIGQALSSTDIDINISESILL